MALSPDGRTLLVGFEPAGMLWINLEVHQGIPALVPRTGSMAVVFDQHNEEGKTSCGGAMVMYTVPHDSNHHHYNNNRQYCITAQADGCSALHGIQ